jgi:hypothetical protein
MEVLRVLRVLWRRRLALALGLLAAAGLALVAGRAQPAASGVAYTRVSLDTPKSQLVASAPAGATTLAWRASLIAHLVASDFDKRQIAVRLGVPFDQIAVVDPPLAVPAVPASLPKNVADATVTAAPYVLSVYLPNGGLPIISIEAYGPDRNGARRLAAAAASFLESESSPSGHRGVQPFIIESAAPVHAKTLKDDSGPLRSVAVFMIVFGLWIVAVVLGPMVLRRLPLPRRRAAAMTP